MCEGGQGVKKKGREQGRKQEGWKDGKQIEEECQKMEKRREGSEKGRKP